MSAGGKGGMSDSNEGSHNYENLDNQDSWEEVLDIEKQRAKENQGERCDLNDTCRSNEREVKDSYEDAAESFARSLKELTIRKRFLMVKKLIV